MLRSVLSVLAGFALWTFLWLASNAIAMAMVPGAFAPDGSTNRTDILVLFLVLSALFSTMAGFATGVFAKRAEGHHGLVLGLLLLAVGIFVQIKYWERRPIWYHAGFLALLAPLARLGGRLRQRQRATNA